MQKVLFLQCLLPLLVFASLCHAQSQDVAAVLAELRTAAPQTETVSARLVQEKHLSIFAETLHSRGLFFYQKPDRIRWELLTPVASGFVLQGKQGVRWNELSREKERFSAATDPIIGRIAQQLLAWARMDITWLQKRYRIKLQTTKPVCLRLYPLDSEEAGFIDHMQIQFAPDLRHVTEVLLVEQGGDSTFIRFNEVEINSQLPPDAFDPPDFR